MEAFFLLKENLPEILEPRHFYDEADIYNLLEDYPMVLVFKDNSKKLGLQHVINPVTECLTQSLYNLLAECKGQGGYTNSWTAFQLELALEELFFGKPNSRTSVQFSVSLGTNGTNTNSLTKRRGFLGLSPAGSASVGEYPPPLSTWFKDQLQQMRVIRIFPLTDSLKAPPVVVGESLVLVLLSDLHEQNDQIPTHSLKDKTPPLFGKLIGCRTVTDFSKDLTPQENISVHLDRKCLKNSTLQDKLLEVRKEKESKKWSLISRTWDYKHISALLPDTRSRQNLIEELLRLGFFMNNLPQESGTDIGALPGEADVPSGLDTITSADDHPSIEECQQVLRVARPDFHKMKSDLEADVELSDTEKTKYRYWCEALLVFRHMQRPKDVEALKDSEWLDRVHHGGRAVLGVKRNKIANMRIALAQEEEAVYFAKIRPGNIFPGKPSKNFFLCSSGEKTHSVTRYMARFLEAYRLSPFGSQDVRAAVLRMAAKKLTGQQQEAVRQYMHPSRISASRCGGSGYAAGILGQVCLFI
ncbi:unnamed protein product [Leuciscus chuanchicus]